MSWLEDCSVKELTSRCSIPDFDDVERCRKGVRKFFHLSLRDLSPPRTIGLCSPSFSVIRGKHHRAERPGRAHHHCIKAGANNAWNNRPCECEIEKANGSDGDWTLTCHFKKKSCLLLKAACDPVLPSFPPRKGWVKTQAHLDSVSSGDDFHVEHAVQTRSSQMWIFLCGRQSAQSNHAARSFEL